MKQLYFKKISFLIAFIAFISLTNAFGQTVTLGTGTNTSNATSITGLGPVNQYYKYMHFQVVYTAAELIAAGAPSGGGTITSFGWNISTAPANAIPNYTIGMANTTATDCATNNVASLTSVYGATNTTFTAGYNMLSLTGAGFYWNGTDNLLVDTCNSGAATYATAYGQVYTYGTTANSSRYLARDTSSACGVATSSSVNAWKPQARFVFAAATPCTTPNPPGAIAVSAITTSTLTLTYAAASPAPTSYILFVSVESTAMPTLVDGTTYTDGNFYTFGGFSYKCVTNTSTSPQGMVSGVGNTKYNYFIYSKNSSCSGEPKYSSGVTNYGIMCPIPPTNFVNSAVSASGGTISWTPAGGTALPLNYTLEVYTNAGYTTHITGSPFSVGTAITKAITGLNPSTTYYYRVKATNGTCESTYLSGGTVTTRCNVTAITASEGFNATTIPNCWDKQIVTSSPQTLSKITFVTSSSYPTMTPSESTHMVKYESNSSAGGGSGSEERLISLPMSSIGTTSVDIEFDWANSNDASYTNVAEGVQVEYSLDGISWTSTGAFISRHDATLTPGTATWKLKTVTVPSALANQTLFYVSLKFHSAWGRNIYIDRFKVKPTPDPILITPSSAAICNGNSTSLTASSTLAYTYTWSPATGLNTTSGATVTASPTATTIYTVTGVSGAVTKINTVTVTVNPVPTNVTLSASNATVCKNTIQAITASGGVSTNAVILTEDFNGAATGWTSINNSTGGTPTNAAWGFYVSYASFYSNDATDFIGSSSYAQGSGGITATELISPAFSLVNYSSANLKFYQYYEYLGTESAKVLISTDNGVTYPTTLVTYTSTQGSATGFSLVSLDLTPYVGNANVKIKFKYDATWDYYWAIDNVSITGTKQKITWSPTTNLYTNSACTTAYVANAHALNVWAKPSTTTTYTATATHGTCDKTATVTYTLESATWSGGSPSWSSSPASNKSIVFDANYTSSGSLEGCNCTINSGNIIISSNDVLKLQDELTVAGGTMTFKNNATLLQKNDVANTGNIIYERTAPSIKGSDYVYWSSPVVNQAINSIYTSPAQGPKYSWNAQVDNLNGQFGNTSNGNWANASGVNMAIGSGYLIRGSSNYSMAATDINSTFTGVPNNGSLSTPVYVYKGTYTDITGYTGINGTSITNMDDNHNLLGNPYPSAISASQFIADNSSIIEGKVKLWKHAFDPSNANPNPFYATYAINYSANDYVTINSTGASISGFSENIKTGQAFFVEMLDDVSVTSPAAVNFNNAQRRDGLGVPYANGAFYRNSSQQNTNTIERHRIWLDIVDANSISETILLGYVTGASAAKESNFDAIAEQLTLGIYSIIASENFVIQGRGLPFDDNDQVSIGFNVPTAGNYSIAISEADGLFLGTQDVYLKDEVLNIYHDLKTTPYSFTATAGIHNDRFKIVYKNGALSNETFNENEIIIAKNKNIIDIVSGTEIMENVKVYDIRGRLLVEKSKINNNTISIDINNIQDQVLIVNIVTTEGIKVIRKIL